MKPKYCPRCKTSKSISDWEKNKRTKDGLQVWCKQCRKENTKENYSHISKYQKDYAQNHKEKLTNYKKQWYQENKPRVRSEFKEKYWSDPESFRERARNEYVVRRDKIFQYFTNRYRTDPEYKILVTLRNRIGSALKGLSKSARTTELVGCSIKQLITHLESNFSAEMSWDNHGTYWDVDHIVPCAAFDLLNPDHQKQCFHWSNLQPLEHIENIRKGDIMPDGIRARHTMK